MVPKKESVSSQSRRRRSFRRGDYGNKRLEKVNKPIISHSLRGWQFINIPAIDFPLATDSSSAH